MTEDTYKTIVGQAEGIYTEKRSKFIAIALPVQTLDEIKEHLEVYQKKYYDARHVCYAYMLGHERKDFRANDNGEPSGTAGKPILGQINSNELTNILIIVVRYFGGIKLGAGGLVRAYGESAGLALNSAATTNLIEATQFSVSLNYGEEGVLNTIKNTEGVYDLKFEYSDKINVTFLANAELEVLNNLNVFKGVTKLVRV